MESEWPIYDENICAFDISQCSSRERDWYLKLSQRLGCTLEDAFIYHIGMHVVRDIGYSKENNAASFPDESPKNRELLIGILEKVVAGDDLPDF